MGLATSCWLTTSAQAQRLLTSLQSAFVNLFELALHARLGSDETLTERDETSADDLIVVSQIHVHFARQRSCQLLAE